jgi:hypothetical protein
MKAMVSGETVSWVVKKRGNMDVTTVGMMVFLLIYACPGSI